MVRDSLSECLADSKLREVRVLSEFGPSVNARHVNNDGLFRSSYRRTKNIGSHDIEQFIFKSRRIFVTRTEFYSMSVRFFYFELSVQYTKDIDGI